MGCLSPIRNKVNNKVYWVACGMCVNCVIDRQNEWIFRLENEMKNSRNGYFTTLTYDDNHLPHIVNELTGEIVQTLKYQDVKDYYNRLRYYSKDVKHYTVGEYGEKTQRPHYHQIIFNVQEKHIKKAWKYGFVYFGKIEEASIRYVTKYMGKRFDNTPYGAALPKNVMSKKLGFSYLTPETIAHHRDNGIDYLINKGGKHIKLPRYFKDKIFVDDWDKLKLRIIHEVEQHAELQFLWDSCASVEKLQFELDSMNREREERALLLEKRLQKKSLSK